MMMLHRRLGAAALGLALGALCVVMFVGARPATAKSAAKPPGRARKSPVQFGVMYVDKNAVVEVPEIEGAARAAAAYFNARGGFNGHIIEPDLCYDTQTVASAVTCEQQFVGDHDAFVTGQTLEDAAVIPALAQANVPVISNYPHSSISVTSPNEYQFQLQVADYYAANAAVLAKQPGAKVVVIVVATPTAGPTVIGAQQGAMSVTGNTPSVVQIPSTAPEMAPYVAAAHAQGNACYLLLGPAQTQQFVTADQASGSACKYYGGPNSDITTSILKTYSPASDLKWIVASPFPPATSTLPSVRAMTAALTAQYRSGDPNANPALVDQVVMSVWLAVNAMYQISHTVTAWTPAGVTAALNQAKKINMLGMIPPWTPSAAGPAGESRASNPYIHIIKVIKKKGYPEGYPVDVLKKPETLSQIEKK